MLNELIYHGEVCDRNVQPVCGLLCSIVVTVIGFAYFSTSDYCLLFYCRITDG